jgi:hypothetical protein
MRKPMQIYDFSKLSASHRSFALWKLKNQSDETTAVSNSIHWKQFAPSYNLAHMILAMELLYAQFNFIRYERENQPR